MVFGVIVNEGDNEGGFALVIGFSLAWGLGGPRYGEDALKGWTTNEEALLRRDNEGRFVLVIGFSLAWGLGGPRYDEDALKGWTTYEEALLGRDNEGRFAPVIGFPLAWGLGGPRHGEEASSGLDYRQRGAAGVWLSTIDYQPSTIFALRVD